MVRFCHAFHSQENNATLPLQLYSCILVEASSVITLPAQYTVISWNIVAKVLSHLDSFENKRTLALTSNSSKSNIYQSAYLFLEIDANSYFILL